MGRGEEGRGGEERRGEARWSGPQQGQGRVQEWLIAVGVGVGGGRRLSSAVAQQISVSAAASSPRGDAQRDSTPLDQPMPARPPHARPGLSPWLSAGRPPVARFVPTGQRIGQREHCEKNLSPSASHRANEPPATGQGRPGQTMRSACPLVLPGVGCSSRSSFSLVSVRLSLVSLGR